MRRIWTESSGVSRRRSAQMMCSKVTGAAAPWSSTANLQVVTALAARELNAAYLDGVERCLTPAQCPDDVLEGDRSGRSLVIDSEFPFREQRGYGDQPVQAAEQDSGQNGADEPQPARRAEAEPQKAEDQQHDASDHCANKVGHEVHDVVHGVLDQQRAIDQGIERRLGDLVVDEP